MRIWHGYASNNSGTYTLVGTLRDVGTAKDVVALLQSVIAQHHAWREQGGTGVPPLHRFIQDHGLTLDDPSHGLADDWPEHGPAPEVVAVDEQVIVHASYTVTMPRTFGEFLYRRGRRVEAELDHAHHPLVCMIRFWVPDGWRPGNEQDAAQRLAALRQRLEQDVFPEQRAAAVEGRRPWFEPVWDAAGWTPVLGLVFADLVPGLLAVQHAAQACGVRMRPRVLEALTADDPLQPLRRRVPSLGRWQTVLWEAGADPTSVLRVVRDVSGLSLADAKELVAQAPCVVLDRVDDREAVEAAGRLTQVGAQVQVLGPHDFGPR